MARYRIINNIIYDTENDIYIPKNESNANYIEYKKWISKGNKPDIGLREDEQKKELINEIYSELLNAIEKLRMDEDMKKYAYIQYLKRSQKYEINNYIRKLKSLKQKVESSIVDIYKVQLPKKKF